MTTLTHQSQPLQLDPLLDDDGDDDNDDDDDNGEDDGHDPPATIRDCAELNPVEMLTNI